MVLRASRLRLTQAIYFGKPQAAAGTGTVTSVGSGTGITTTPNPIIGIGTVALTTPVSNANGGTGADTSATGGAGEYVKQAGIGAAFTVGTIPASDVGAGFVKVDGTTPLTADWNASNSTVTPEGIASRNSTSWFNVVAYGADPTGAVSSTVAVQAAVTAASAVGGVIYFPHGLYDCTSGTITVSTTKTVMFRGDGTSGSNIKLPPAADGFHITAANTNQQYIAFYDLALTPSGVVTAGAAIHSDAANQFSLLVNGCRFGGHFIGIQMNTNWMSGITRCQFATGVAGATDILIDNTINDDQGDNEITGCTFWSNGAYNIRQRAGGGTRISSNKFIGPAGYSIYVDTQVGKQTGVLFVQFNSFEGLTTNANVALVPDGSWSETIIASNEFIGTPGKPIILVAPTATGLATSGLVYGNVMSTGAESIKFNPGQAGGADSWLISDNGLYTPSVAAIQLPATVANLTNLSIGQNVFVPTGGSVYVSGTFSASSGFGFPGIFTKAGFNTVAPTREIDLNGTARSRGIAAPAVSELGSGTIYFDSGLNKYRVSMNGAAYVDLVGSAGVTGSGVGGKLAYWSAATVLTDEPNITLGGAYTLDVNGDINLDAAGNTIRVAGSKIFAFDPFQGNINVGSSAPLAGSGNSYVGSAAGLVSAGNNNTGVGDAALENATVDHNTAVGVSALGATTTGGENVAVGYRAGLTNITGSDNTLLGPDADVSAPNLSNAIAIGYQAVVGASNSCTIGNASMQVGIRTGTPALALDVAAAMGTRHLDITLVNGLNSDIALTDTSFVRVIGPTGVFSLGGFTAGADGRHLIVYNTVAFQMTIVNEDGASTATNRITTLTGGNVVLRPGTSAATFIFDGTADRWILLSSN